MECQVSPMCHQNEGKINQSNSPENIHGAVFHTQA